ncbi:chaperone DnaJ protein [Perkinsela sp. CCAP 1560/4]|nr:chaperone DnaJ protein [Perkinsela sp. CCAP 1560/4]|eukprot:KNH07297.1 chaperone DnaJ protein [Perkinsela sp. CCAP 1560/4]
MPVHRLTKHCRAVSQEASLYGISTRWQGNFSPGTRKSASANDFYNLLGVSRNASQDDIKKAYRAKTKKYHPDVNPHPDAAKQFSEINQAYDTLKDSQRRSMYDMTGAPSSSTGAQPGGGNPFGFRNMAQNPFTGFDSGNPFGQSANMNFDPNMKMDFNQFEEVFERMAKGSGASEKGKRSFGPMKGNDIHFKLNISFVESIRGSTKHICYKGTHLCGSCHGTTSKNGEKRIKCAYCDGRGKTVMSTGFFHLQQDCTHCEGLGERHRASCADCDGRGVVTASIEQQLPVPQGVENGDRLKVLGKGEVGLRGGSNGNLFVEIYITDEKNSVFTRSGVDLHIVVPVPVTTAVLGGVVRIPNLEYEVPTGRQSSDQQSTKDGDMPPQPRHLVEIHVPSSTQQGDKLVLKNKGVTKMRNVDGIRKKVTGDMIVHFSVLLPRSLSDSQLQLFTSFARAMETGPQGENTAGKIDAVDFSRYPSGPLNYKLFRQCKDKCRSGIPS